MTVMKKRGYGVSRPMAWKDDRLPAQFKRTLKSTEKQFSKSFERIMKHTWMKHEQEIANPKECLASEVLAELDFCLLFPGAPGDQFPDISSVLHRGPESYSGRSVSGGRALWWTSKL
jgi:hypothetical protein